MLLRPLVLLLLLANLAFFAWSQGHLRMLGFGPAQQAEPQRLTQQLRPQLLRVLREGAPAVAPVETAPAPAPAAPEPAPQ
jgi:hypothetical protein